MMIFKNKNRGFSLIEMLIVISMMGILSLIIFPSVSQIQKKAKLVSMN